MSGNYNKTKEMNHSIFSRYVSVSLAKLLCLFSYLPLWFLYGVSWLFAFLIYRVFRYRVKVVRQNLRNAFPEKSSKERRIIERKFYHHFSDVMMEVLKLRTISPANLKQRCVYSEATQNLLNKYYSQGRSILIVLAHTANWEWAGAAYPLYNKHQVITAYRPLRDKIFDKDTLDMRKRTGNILASMKNLVREIFKHRNEVIATALIGDQTPPPDNAFWIKFLHQETPFFKGTEVLARKFNTPIFWGSVKKVRRGHYFIHFELITDNPREFTEEGSLTCLHASYLERDIKAQPESWLWSHRRWKHKRPEGAKLVCSTQKAGWA